MERRQAERRAIIGNAKGGLIFLEPAELADMSSSGIRFKFLHKIDPSTTQRIAVRHEEKVFHLRGEVVRSTVVETRKILDVNYPVYEIAMHFDDPSSARAASLNRLLEES